MRRSVYKTAERKIATARVRGMKGVCRFGQKYACVQERCNAEGMARVKSHVIRVQNDLVIMTP